MHAATIRVNKFHSGLEKCKERAIGMIEMFSARNFGMEHSDLNIITGRTSQSSRNSEVWESTSEVEARRLDRASEEAIKYPNHLTSIYVDDFNFARIFAAFARSRNRSKIQAP